MNWFKKAVWRRDVENTYSDEDMMEYLNAILNEELEGNDLEPIDKIIIKEKLEKVLNSFPPGYQLKKTYNGWSVVSPKGHVVSLNERHLLHSLLGGKARFDFMGLTV